jgi:hypothetical protein
MCQKEPKKKINYRVRMCPCPNLGRQDNADSLMEVASRAAEQDKVFMLNLGAPFIIHYFQVENCPI